MATLYEYYHSHSFGYSIRATFFTTQTFTPVTTHTITSVKLRLYRVGSPGTLTVKIYAVDGAGKPTGAALATGTTDGNTLTTSSSGEIREITLGAGTDLASGTKYAIVASGTGDTSNYGVWRVKSSGTYTVGKIGYSTDGGSTWTMVSTVDGWFEDWGDPIVTVTFIPKVQII